MCHLVWAIAAPPARSAQAQQPASGVAEPQLAIGKVLRFYSLRGLVRRHWFYFNVQITIGVGLAH
jgi:hypothetical protein